ncbi:group II intron reverse transcriptase/maturase [Candidatus Neptunochlamydia vexilliferae]|nr:group II intron reverse transcriptase/maturase [Candidatus Neptunochlamydia vexilliferae]
MTANQADANPCITENWKSIDWIQTRRDVRRLQARIVKAFKRKDYLKVKDLRRLLIRSLSARRLAVYRVTTNKGSKTAGADGQVWKTSRSKEQAVKDLARKDIQELPLRRVSIPKKNGKKRPLGIPTMISRSRQALYLLSLDPIAEAKADSRSYGFRVGRRAADAISYLHKLLSRKNSAQWILEGDIRSCFDEINHQWIEKNIPIEEKVLRKWLKAGYIKNNRLYPTDKGSPQGGIISPVIANMTLDGMEKVLYETFGYPGSRKIRETKVHLCRYADDFVITGSSKALLEEKVKPLIESFLRERGLELSREKTLITHISKGFDFLGQNICKHGDKLLIKPSKQSISSVKQKLKDTIQRMWHSPRMLVKLNAITRGWCNYHRYINHTKTFKSLEKYMYETLWRKAKREHPMKSRKWIKNKYFHKYGNRDWIFTSKDEKGNIQKQILPSSILVKRYYLIRGEANPYDNDWKYYYEDRYTHECNRINRETIYKTWERQKGKCSKCGEEISLDQKRYHLHFPKDNVALDKKTPWQQAHILHTSCLKSRVFR